MSLALERIVFFSDAVMAIAITLLAFDLRLPSATVVDNESLLRELAALGPRYFSFAVSFAVIAVYWTAHHRIFRHVVQFDGGLLVINLAFLFFVVQLPFLAAILGAHGQLPVATAVYAAGLFAMGLTSTLLWTYATRRGLTDTAQAPDIADFQRRSLAIALVFAASIPLAFVAWGLAQLAWTATLIVFVVQRWFRRPRAKMEAG
jgi:uncharacterized membrane protein